MSVNSTATLQIVKKTQPAFAAFLETYFSGDELWSISEDESLMIKDISPQEKYFRSKRSLALKFLGFPAENIKNSEQSATNLVRNMFGWRATKNSSWLEIGVNVVFAPLTFVWNLVKIIPRFALNIAKLVTEFLPSLAINALENIAEANKESNRAKFYLAKTASFALQSVRFITRAVTSPIANIKAAYQRGQELVGPGTGGKVLGAVLGFVSGLITAATYLILFPIAIKAIAAHVVPHIASQLPAAVVPHLDKLGAAVHTVGSVVTSAFSSAGATFTGLAAFAAVAGVATNLIMGAKNWIMKKWSAVTSKKTLDKIFDGVDIKPGSTFKASTERSYRDTGLVRKKGEFIEPAPKTSLSSTAEIMIGADPVTDPKVIAAKAKRQIKEEKEAAKAAERSRLAEEAAIKAAADKAKLVQVKTELSTVCAEITRKIEALPGHDTALSRWKERLNDLRKANTEWTLEKVLNSAFPHHGHAAQKNEILSLMDKAKALAKVDVYRNEAKRESIDLDIAASASIKKEDAIYEAIDEKTGGMGTMIRSLMTNSMTGSGNG